MLSMPFNAVFMPLWEASKRVCAELSGAGSVEKLEFQYEIGCSLFPSALAAALTNPMVRVSLDHFFVPNIQTSSCLSLAHEAHKGSFSVLLVHAGRDISSVLESIGKAKVFLPLYE